MPTSVGTQDMEQLALAGDTHAQLDLAYRFVFGYGVAVDFTKAYAWVYVASLTKAPMALELEALIARSLYNKELQERGTQEGLDLALRINQ